MPEAKKILIIEDDEATLKLYSHFLEKQGYEVCTAENGREGLEKIGECKPDLIMLDIVMPELDGIETLKRIKSDSKMSSIPVIMLTVLETSQKIKEAVEAGATHYMIKSDYSLEEMGEKVRDVLNNPPKVV